MEDEFDYCYLPGWDDGPDGLYCERPNEHDGEHAAPPSDDPDDEVTWPVTWIVDEEDFPFGN